MGGINWGMLLGQGLVMIEDLLMAVQKLRSLEGLRYVLLVVSQMGSLLVILGKSTGMSNWYIWWI